MIAQIIEWVEPVLLVGGWVMTLYYQHHLYRLAEQVSRVEDFRAILKKVGGE
jgi:hypothetical protein